MRYPHGSDRLRLEQGPTLPAALAIGGMALAVCGTLACGGSPPAPATRASEAPTPPPMTAEQSVAFYEKCWELFNTKAWDAFQNCYTKDATSDNVDSGQPVANGRAAIVEAGKAGVAPFPDARGDLQLVLANGPRILGIALWKGTQTAPMPLPDGKSIPATGKSFGFLMAHTVELDAGRTAAAREAAYVDVGTLLAQLGVSKTPARKAIEAASAVPTVVLAKDSEDEAKNVAAVQAQLDAFNKHDLTGIGATMGADFTMHEIATPSDQDRKQNLAGLAELFKGFSDVKLTTSDVWGAGDYVVAIGSFDGTNDGPVPSMGLKKKTGKHVTAHFAEVFRFENGKVAEDWLFYNGAAFATQLGLS